MTRQPTEEEQQLWLAISRTIQPLHQKPRKKAIPQDNQHPTITDSIHPPPLSAASKENPKLTKQKASFIEKEQPLTSKKQEPSAAISSWQNNTNIDSLFMVDGNTANRLKAGKLPLEAVLDLHGQTTEVAFSLLQQFIQHYYQIGARCLLIITGKGLRSRETGGVLRKKVPEWLNDAPLRQKIIAFTAAQPKHGGSGAYYVLLKRH